MLIDGLPATHAVRDDPALTSAPIDLVQVQARVFHGVPDKSVEELFEHY